MNFIKINKTASGMASTKVVNRSPNKLSNRKQSFQRGRENSTPTRSNLSNKQKFFNTSKVKYSKRSEFIHKTKFKNKSGKWNKLEVQNKNKILTDEQKALKGKALLSKGMFLNDKGIAPLSKRDHIEKSTDPRFSHLYSFYKSILLKDLPDLKNTFDNIIIKFRTIEKSRDTQTAIGWMKGLRTRFVQILSKSELTIPKRTRIATSKTGYPLILEPLRLKIESGDLTHIRHAFSILTISRMLTKDIEIDTGPIIQKYTGILTMNSIQGEYFVRELRNTVGEMRKSIGITSEILRFPAKSPEFHLMTSSGPNGSTLRNAHMEVRDPWFKKNVDNIKILLDDRPITYKTMLQYESISPKLDKYLQKAGIGKVLERPWNQTSKLMLVPDVEYKQRCVGIHPYLFNETMRGTHYGASMFLKKLESDCTWDQNKIKDFVKAFWGKERFSCFDLKDFSDRLPIWIQEVVISRLYSAEKAKAWSDMFRSMTYSQDIGQEIKYEVGTSMGGISSWPVAALTHHVLVQMASKMSVEQKKLKLKENKLFMDYRLLGDDLVICNDDVATNYKSICNMLGLVIQMEKSYQSANFVEFAKRYFYKSREVSPFLWQAVLASGTDYHLWAQYSNLQYTHGWSNEPYTVHKLGDNSETKPIARYYKNLFISYCQHCGMYKTALRGLSRRFEQMFALVFARANPVLPALRDFAYSMNMHVSLSARRSSELKRFNHLLLMAIMPLIGKMAELTDKRINDLSEKAMLCYYQLSRLSVGTPANSSSTTPREKNFSDEILDTLVSVPPIRVLKSGVKEFSQLAEYMMMEIVTSKKSIEGETLLELLKDSTMLNSFLYRPELILTGRKDRSRVHGALHPIILKSMGYCIQGIDPSLHINMPRKSKEVKSIKSPIKPSSQSNTKPDKCGFSRCCVKSLCILKKIHSINQFSYYIVCSEEEQYNSIKGYSINI